MPDLYSFVYLLGKNIWSRELQPIFQSNSVTMESGIDEIEDYLHIPEMGLEMVLDQEDNISAIFYHVSEAYDALHAISSVFVVPFNIAPSSTPKSLIRILGEPYNQGHDLDQFYSWLFKNFQLWVGYDSASGAVSLVEVELINRAVKVDLAEFPEISGIVQ